jgi:hypothetical protein
MSKYVLYEVDEDKNLYDTGKTVELQSEDQENVINSVFAIYGFNQYASYFRTSEDQGKIDIKYPFHNGDRIVWSLKLVQD